MFDFLPGTLDKFRESIWSHTMLANYLTIRVFLAGLWVVARRCSGRLSVGLLVVVGKRFGVEYFAGGVDRFNFPLAVETGGDVFV